jgi:hypothetical protein
MTMTQNTIPKKIQMKFNRKPQKPPSHHSLRLKNSHQTLRPSNVHTKVVQNLSTDLLVWQHICDPIQMSGRSLAAMLVVIKRIWKKSI